MIKHQIVCDKCGKEIGYQNIMCTEASDWQGLLIETEEVQKSINELNDELLIDDQPIGLCIECQRRANKMLKSWVMEEKKVENPPFMVIPDSEIELPFSEPEEKEVIVPEKIKAKKKPGPKKKPTKQKESDRIDWVNFDWDKCKALKTAGWQWNQISGEMLHDESKVMMDRLKNAYAYYVRNKR